MAEPLTIERPGGEGRAAQPERSHRGSGRRVTGCRGGLAGGESRRGNRRRVD